METIVKLDKFSATPFKQEIELQQAEYAVDFITLRVRIREGSRFTVFDIDEHTATRWGLAMLEWADLQKQVREVQN